MDLAEPVSERPTDEWCARHFDHLSPVMWHHLHETMARMREHQPVAYSDQHGGFWVVSRYEDVLRVAQDWRSFSSAHGTGVPRGNEPVVPAIPEHVDPPLHTVYKRLINAYFTPAAVARYEEPTRWLATRLIDRFIGSGQCDLMAQFARPFPGLAFFDQVLHAPADEVERINTMATAASMPGHPNARESWQGMFSWIQEFVDQRRHEPVRGDVVDAVLAAEIEGRPITDREVYGIIQLLILGGLETTAGALGQFFIRFCHEPEIAALLRSHPELIPSAIEELLRLEGSFVAIVRTATCDTEVAGQPIKAGDRVMIHWASANRDDTEFSCPARFDLERRSNRHLTFGAGPHRCAGSNLARMNLRVALEELLGRLTDIKLEPGAEPLPFHSALNRTPLSVPITFTPPGRETSGTT
jgi:cytochrome P450